MMAKLRNTPQPPKGGGGLVVFIKDCGFVEKLDVDVCYRHVTPRGYFFVYRSIIKNKQRVNERCP